MHLPALDSETGGSKSPVCLSALWDASSREELFQMGSSNRQVKAAQGEKVLGNWGLEATSSILDSAHSQNLVYPCQIPLGFPQMTDGSPGWPVNTDVIWAFR